MARGKVAAKVGRAACPHAAEGGVLATKNTETTKAMKPSGVAWLGDIPEGWEIGRVKNSFYHTKEVVKERAAEFDRLALTLQGVIKRPKEDTNGLQPKEFEGYQVLRKNELVFKLIDLQNISTSRVGRSSYDGIVSPAYIILHPRDNSSTAFACYYFLSMWMHNIFQTLGGDAVRSCLNASDLLNVPLPLPPLPEQRAIADYLDEKCGAIDAAIAEAKKGIEEYKAWKTSLIDDVVCNGIVRRDGRKETGEVWLADIPDEWEFTQIRYLFALRDERNDKPLKDVNLISLYTDKGVVQHSDLEKTTGNKASTADGYKLVYENDIVVNIILCWMGAVGRSAYNGVTSPAYDVYRPINPTKVLSRYYHYLFRTPRFNGKCYEEGRGIMMMRWRTYSSEFRAIKVPVPPIEEQQAIADYLDEKCAAIAAMVAEKEALIADLEAYKQSLIYETVTGKREVA